MEEKQFSSIARLRAELMVRLGRIYTKDRHTRFGIVNDGKCAFCNNKESIEHLFFEYSYPKEVWSNVLRWMKINEMMN